MTLLTVSISHHTATVDMLARVSLNPAQRRRFEHHLLSSEDINEAMVLSTCNRTEVFINTARFHTGLETVVATLVSQTAVRLAEMPEVCTVRYDDAATAHCFALAAGLESMVVGENQVLGQVREALTASQQSGHTGPVLNTVFQNALRVGKRVHSETSVGNSGRSVLSSALQLLDARHHLTNGTCLVVGAGSMAGLSARTMARRGFLVTCMNRTLAGAERLAAEVGGRAVHFDQLHLEVSRHDVVITCTGSAGSLISCADVTDRPRAILDLAMPPDVSPTVGKQTLLINLASLSAHGDDPGVDVQQARDLVAEELTTFLDRRRADAVTPTVVALRSLATGVVAAELERLQRRLPDLDDPTRAEVANSLRRVSDKLLHQPTVNVRQLATAEPLVDYPQALRHLFALDADDTREAAWNEGERDIYAVFNDVADTRVFFQRLEL